MSEELLYILRVLSRLDPSLHSIPSLPPFSPVLLLQFPIILPSSAPRSVRGEPRASRAAGVWVWDPGVASQCMSDLIAERMAELLAEGKDPAFSTAYVLPTSGSSREPRLVPGSWLGAAPRAVQHFCTFGVLLGAALERPDILCTANFLARCGPWVVQLCMYCKSSGAKCALKGCTTLYRGHASC